MDDLQQLAGIVVALAGLLVFAAMIWAGQHQS
jgi:hypothetical protein